MTSVKLYLFVTIFVLVISLIDADADDNDCKLLKYFDASVKGTISSPFYGTRPYTGTFHCNYLIKGPEGQRIKITFKDFDVHLAKNCAFHRLSISGKNGRVLASMCGNHLPRPVLSEKGEELLLSYAVDGMGSGRGFLLEYESGPDLELCEHGESSCVNRNCYKSEKKCDGVDDCGDGTDEEDCNHPVVAIPKNCGVQTIKPKDSYDRIVGGEEAVSNSWPWQVALSGNHTEPSSLFCGGTLINSQWVLTAAHCVTRRYVPGAIKVFLGAHSLLDSTSYQQTRRSVKVIGYPDLTGEKIKNYRIDLALIKLNAPVTFNDGVQPACLPDFQFQPPTGWQCYATGWGYTYGSGGSEVLKQLKVVVQPEEKCSLGGDLVCIWKAKQSVCHGDSGGPLNCQFFGQWYVLGASATFYSEVTAMVECAGTNSYAGYASIVGKVSWIKETIDKYA